MPLYNLQLAHGDGTRDAISHNSGERQLALGDQVHIDDECWELAATEGDTYVCGPCRPYAIFTFDNHTAPILQRDVTDLDRGLRNLHLQEPDAVSGIRAALAQANPDASLQIGLGDEEVSELYQAVFAMQVEGPLSGDLDHLRIECYRYLDDRGHFPHDPQVPPLP